MNQHVTYKPDEQHGMVANVLIHDEDDRADLVRSAEIALAKGEATREDGDSIFFDFPGMPIHDEEDEESGPLHVQHMDRDGEGVSLYAPYCWDVGEIERRMYRDVTHDFTIDDSGMAAVDGRIAVWRILEVGPNGAHGSRKLADVVAIDGFGALNVYSHQQGFSNYVRADSDDEYERLSDQGDCIPAHYSEAHSAWCGVFTNYEIGAYLVRHVTATCDVTGLDEADVDKLYGFLSAATESERDSGFPGVVSTTIETTPPFPQVETRTILVHLNIEVPVDAPCTADDVADEVQSALEIAGESQNAPILYGSTVVIPLSEEI